MRAPPRRTTARPGVNPGRPLGSGNPSSSARNIPRRRTGTQTEFRRLALLEQFLGLMAEGRRLHRQFTPGGEYWTVGDRRVPQDIAYRLFMCAHVEVDDPGLFGGHQFAQSYRLSRK
jgi:hypothetical protein